MPWWEIVIIMFVTFIIFAFIHFLSKNKRPFKRAMLSIFIGIATLLAINFTSGITGVYIPISLLSVLVSAIGGVPGVTLMLVLNLFF